MGHRQFTTSHKTFSFPIAHSMASTQDFLFQENIAHREVLLPYIWPLYETVCSPTICGVRLGRFYSPVKGSKFVLLYGTGPFIWAMKLKLRRCSFDENEIPRPCWCCVLACAWDHQQAHRTGRTPRLVGVAALNPRKHQQGRGDRWSVIISDRYSVFGGLY
jgi:hypothetical protein